MHPLTSDQLLKNLVNALEARTEADRQMATAHADAIHYFAEKARKAPAGWNGTLPTWPRPAGNQDHAEFGPPVPSAVEVIDSEVA